MPRWLHSSMKCVPFSADSENSMPLLATMPTGCPAMCANAVTSVAPLARFEFVEFGTVDDARDDFAHVELLARVGRNYHIQLVRVEDRFRAARACRVTPP